MTTQNTNPELTFEQAVARLEKLATEMDNGNLELDKMIQAFEEGQTLVKHCYSKLNEVEKKIELLVKQDDDSVKTEPFDVEK